MNKKNMQEQQGAGTKIEEQGAAEQGTANDQASLGQTGQTNEKPPVTFTQEQVKAMMAKEKAQGKAAMLRELGVEDAESAKKELAAHKEYVESQKTELEKAQGLTEAEKAARAALEKENALLKFKFEAIALGVKPECADDFAVIVATKTKDGETMADVVKALKEKPEYGGFFNGVTPQQTGGQGTGNNVNGRRVNNSTESIGKRLGEQVSKSGAAKSSFFKH